MNVLDVPLRKLNSKSLKPKMNMALFSTNCKCKFRDFSARQKSVYECKTQNLIAAQLIVSVFVFIRAVNQMPHLCLIIPKVISEEIP